MIKIFKEFSTKAILKIGDTAILQNADIEQSEELYTFVWANSEDVYLKVDSIPLTLPANSILALTPVQKIAIQEGDGIVYQFNREFYCIKDHDKEVSCLGLLFFGNIISPIIELDAKEQLRFNTLHEVFLEELDTKDTIQAEMLRMLMARFIIKTTRLLKLGATTVEKHGGNLDLLRQFNYLVENHFRQSHSVSYYAEKLHKSPKTLSNKFSKYKKSPIQIIHDRIILEAKRQLTYTDKTTKEIAYDIGFDDASHLSRMFKKQTGISPTEFKKSLLPLPQVQLIA